MFIYSVLLDGAVGEGLGFAVDRGFKGMDPDAAAFNCNGYRSLDAVAACIFDIDICFFDRHGADGVAVLGFNAVLAVFDGN